MYPEEMVIKIELEHKKRHVKYIFAQPLALISLFVMLITFAAGKTNFKLVQTLRSQKNTTGQTEDPNIQT